MTPYAEYCPSFRARSVLDIGARFLDDNGFTHVIFDLDNCLVDSKSEHIQPAIQAHVANLAGQYAISLVSNTFDPVRVSLLAGRLGITRFYYPGFDFLRWKPSPWMLREAMFDFAVRPEETLMVGDQLSDIIAATRAGCSSLLIKPTSRTYHWSTRLFKLGKQYRRLKALAKAHCLPPFIHQLGREPL
jgi:HAD superfamily phosphatase (TIGR01668 family)